MHYTKTQLQELFHLHLTLIRLQEEYIKELRQQIELLVKSNEHYREITALLEKPASKAGK